MDASCNDASRYVEAFRKNNIDGESLAMLEGRHLGMLRMRVALASPLDSSL